ncbi:MAG: hypothetical protein J2P35_24000, partial [Actinobacteria bacterium]|nr:hypothetical protein [Actinomycetota bacterium]
GRLDWLVPPIMLAGQYVYLAALGFAAGVPGGMVFALVTLIAVSQLEGARRAGEQRGLATRSVPAPQRPAAPPRPGPPGPGERAGPGVGWDGRVLLAAAGALLGIAWFAYALLTAYVGVLLARSLLSGRELDAATAAGEGGIG